MFSLIAIYKKKYGLTGHFGWTAAALMKEAELIGSANAYLGAASSALDATYYATKLQEGQPNMAAVYAMAKHPKVKHCMEQAKLRMFEAL